MATYKWKPASHIILAPDAVGKELEELRQAQEGRLTPDMVVEHASDEHSLLHPAFEWNDTTAAHQYRCHQARHLINCLVYIKEGYPEVRAFVSVIQEGDQAHSYTHILHAMEHPKLRQQVLDQAKDDLLAWETRYHHLEEFHRVHQIIQETFAH